MKDLSIVITLQRRITTLLLREQKQIHNFNRVRLPDPTRTTSLRYHRASKYYDVFLLIYIT
jgi:hypothetical protein